MGGPSQSKIANQKLFGDPQNGIIGHYEQMALDGYIKDSEAVKLSRAAFVSVRERAQKADAAILESNINKRVNIAGDVRNSSVQERNRAYNDLVADINKAVASNTITADEGEKKKRAAADDTVRQTFLGLMTAASSAEAVVLQIAQGDIKDPVMKSLIGQMDAGDQVKLISDMFTLGNKIDTERREKEEADEEAAEEENKKNFQTIINVDPTDAEAMTAAKALHKELLADDFYTDVQRTAAEKRLGIQKTSTGTDIKTTKNAVKILRTADLNNTLTLDLVNGLINELSRADYDKYLNLVISEQREGITQAKTLIAADLNYNELKDTTNALGEAADALYAQSEKELTNWLETEGKGASYDEIIAKSRQILQSNNEKIKKRMNRALASYLSSQSRNLPGLPMDIEGAKVFLYDLLKTNPGNRLAVAVVNQIEAIEEVIGD
jgi:hypothetical protein